ncbi:uncharacterized protein K460DRAFT_340230 [Cucurbitaria berberidis CBS 394.84]|uniref:Uncharacterized protein n=1 Tax=Cucurbitaria berberidis CBS 394.84 TaxID=1168544 RepID=A0A9P4GC23_9PLEO|nr:uncharacterized protein K460DRAFT_340230 [Cucurbitaria berberidis CBS 394.84]KAF1842791.1 hypothetical protein K460DRAFT_340230 [Cucurbitaria berberidis CBS 394.84]
MQNASARPSLSPADCRTLGKILSDVRSPSPLSVPDVSEVDASFLSATAATDKNRASAYKDDAQYEDEQYECGDEREGGYEDEDGSMELSDVDGQEPLGLAEYEPDTIEDIMNLPGQTAPPAPVQDFSNLYAHDLPADYEMKKKQELAARASIEEALEKQRLEHEGVQLVAAEDDRYEDYMALDEMQGEELDFSEDPVFQALQVEIGMRAMNKDEEEEGEVEVRLTTHPPTVTTARRASEDAPMSSLSFPLQVNSPAVIQTPGGKHIGFAPNATIPDTPFAKTLNYFKQYKGKENSPSKRRRNASSPEEIAELAREAIDDDEEGLKDLDKYREMDLAPMEPVMESDSAGDLITLGTPAKARRSQSFTAVGQGPFQLQCMLANERVGLDQHTIPELVEAANEEIECDALRQLEDREQTASPLFTHSSIREQDKDNDADTEDSDYVSRTVQKENQLVQISQHPTFILVVEMLPGAMFWATAAQIVKYSNGAFDMLVEKLTGLKV